MTTTPKTNQTSSPREFFQRLYGDLECKSEIKSKDNYLGNDEKTSAVVTPIPLLAAPLPFPFSSNGEAHFSAAAAAGLTAFRKLNLFIFSIKLYWALFCNHTF